MQLENRLDEWDERMKQDWREYSTTRKLPLNWDIQREELMGLLEQKYLEYCKVPAFRLFPS